MTKKNSPIEKTTYVAFLRGINVGGHHKVPMAELKKEMTKMGFTNVETLLNSGNVLFDSEENRLMDLEKGISDRLEKTFGFPIPTLIRNIDLIHDLLNEDPFKNIVVTKDIRLYVSFLNIDVKDPTPLPWSSEDGSYEILSRQDKTVLSVLDVSRSGTPQAMQALELFYGKDITTRNWNTIKRIEKKLGPRS
ncbi:DUF1697 domain-containing protein [Maribacter algicola]|uniref:DUF1697 domain-containing protein n=1 Tax=Meishania litoralis TaxID=3434685 RepID=A0ACC7LIQ3_9FLAO